MSSPAALSAPSSARPSARTDRVGLLGGLALGGVMMIIAVGVALSGGQASGVPSQVAVPPGGTQVVAVRLADMRITPAGIDVTAGTRVVLEVTNTDAMLHDLRIDAGPGTPMLPPGGTARLDLGILRRTAAGWCTVPGHKAAGMTMSIKVTEGR